MHARSSLKAQAFEEFKVTRQTSTGNGELYCGMVEYGDPGIPSFFVRDELGYDGPVGVRLQRMIPQAELERMHQRQEAVSIAAPDAMLAKRKPRRETPESRRAKLQQMRLRAELQLRQRAA